MYNFDFNTLIPLLVVLIIFLIGRELVCWYLKTTENIQLLKEIKLLLIDIRDKLSDKKENELKTEKTT